MERTIRVFAPGTEVAIAPGGDHIRGKIVEVAINDGGTIQYRVAWWNGRTRNCDWLSASEVSWTDGAERVRIGFV